MSDQNSYFRRCHVCGGLTEFNGSEDIERCVHCEKAFARFQYFDDRMAPVQSDAHLRPVFAASEYEPVKGLTAHWTQIES